jgi:hypothetical protein
MCRDCHGDGCNPLQKNSLPTVGLRPNPGLPEYIICLPKIPIWAYIFWKALERKLFSKFYDRLEYYVTAIWNTYICYLPFGICYWHLEYFMVIWFTLEPFGMFCGRLVFFPHFWMLYHEKSGSSSQQFHWRNENCILSNTWITLGQWNQSYFW